MIHVLVGNNQQFIFITVPTEITSTPSKLSGDTVQSEVLSRQTLYFSQP